MPVRPKGRPKGSPDGLRVRLRKALAKQAPGIVLQGFKDKDTFDRYRRRAAGHLAKLWKALGKSSSAEGQ